MRRPLLYLAVGAVILVAAAAPAFWLALTPGSSFGIPRFPQSVRGFDVLRAATGPGAVAPTVVLVDSGRAGGVRTSPVLAAVGRLTAELREDPEVARELWAPAGSEERRVGKECRSRWS